jgi:hypothetical protein
MKTSNKILLTGFIIVVLGIIALTIIVKSNIRKAVKTQEENIKTEEITLQNFDCVHVQGNIRVEWTQDSPQQVKIKADNNASNHVKTEVNDGCLLIKAENNSDKSFRGVVQIQKEVLKEIRLENGSRFESESRISANNIKINVSSNSDLELDGEADSVDIFCSSNSRLDMENFKVINCNIEAESSTRAEVYATGKLNITAKSNSSVFYSGNPETLNVNTSGGGKIEKD